MRLLAWLVVTLAAVIVTDAPAWGQAPAAPSPAPPPATPAPVAAAAPPSDAPTAANSDEAREHFKRGEAAYQKGSYDAAIVEWEAAYARDPRPRIQYNLFQARERLGQLGEAAEALKRYLSTADPDDPSYADATARMTALQQRLQTTGIRLVGGVDGAAVSVSGHDWGRLPRPDRIPVQPGNHRVVVTLQGYKDFTANVLVPAAQVVDLLVQLEPTGAVPGSIAADGSQSEGSAGATVHDGAGSDPTPFFVASAVLGAGAIGAGVWALNRVSELDGCSSAQFFCSEQSAVTTQRNIAIGVTAVLAVGAVGTLVYGLLSDSGEGAEASAQAGVRCVPGLLGATCAGRF